MFSNQSHNATLQTLSKIGITTGIPQGGRAGGAAAPPDFGRSEGAAGQRRRAALLLAHPDFQSLRHPWVVGM